MDQLPIEMRGDVPFIDCLHCGSVTSRLQEMQLWFSSGNTTSSFHFDTFHNLNCQLHGTKYWFLIDREVRLITVTLCNNSVYVFVFVYLFVCQFVCLSACLSV